MKKRAGIHTQSVEVCGHRMNQDGGFINPIGLQLPLNNTAAWSELNEPGHSTDIVTTQAALCVVFFFHYQHAIHLGMGWATKDPLIAQENQNVCLVST